MSNATHFGRYELLERLAQGGMAEVFLARTGGASGFQKELVIKRILPEFTGDPQFVRMFVDEARIAAQLHHPNIVQVFDFDEVEGNYFIAMEYVEGCDLRTIMELTAERGEQIDLAEALYIAMEVAKALDYAHRRRSHGNPLNIVHRDVSPHNVLVSFEAAVKLTDFGIAKAQSRATRTQDGVVKGKVSYMSPEQARGKRLDARSDLFSLGTVLFELVTLRRLFWADSDREILRKVMAADVPSPRSFNRSLPTEIERIVMRLLARRVEQRYGSAGELLEDLSRAYHEVAQGSSELLVRQRLARLFPERTSQATPAPSTAVSEPGSWPPASRWPGRPGTPVLSGAPDETPPPEPSRRAQPPPLPQGRHSGTPPEARAPRSAPTAPPVLEPPAPAPSAERRPQETAFAAPASGSDPSLPPTPETRLHDPRVRERSQRGRQVRRFDRQKVVRGEAGPQGEAFFESGTRLYGKDRERPESLRPRRSLTVGTALTLAGLLIGVGTLVGVLYALSRDEPAADLAAPARFEADAAEEPAPDSPEPQALTEGTVIVRTVPSGARVSVEGSPLPGQTPLAVSVPLNRSTQLTIELDGFAPETLQVTVDQSDRPIEQLLRLQEAPDSAP